MAFRSVVASFLWLTNALSIFQAETGITAERLKEPDDVEATDQCNTCPLNKSLNPAKGNKCGSHATSTFEGPVSTPLAPPRSH